MTAVAVDADRWVWVSGNEVQDRPTAPGSLSDVGWILSHATDPGTSMVIPTDPIGRGRLALVEHIQACPNWDAQPTEGAWIVAKHRRGPRIAIGVREWMDDPYLPAELGTTDVAYRLADWETAVGHRYQHNPGAAALMALRARGIAGGVRWRLQNVATAEWWQPPGNIPEWRWKAPQRLYKGQTVHRWDMRSAYLAAAAAAELPRLRLAPTGADGDPAETVGYFRITPVSARARAVFDGWLRLVLHPDRHGAVWTTSGLLRAVSLGRGDVEIHDSWTAGKDDRPGRLLRPWAENIRDAINGQLPDWLDPSPALGPALKAGYAHAIGLMGAPRGSVYRPDWRHLIIGTQQGSMLRRIMRVNQLLGLWPVKVDVDSLWYATDNPDQVGEALGVGPLVGRMRYEGEDTP